MERSGLPLSSMSALGTSLWFLIQVLFLLTDAFSMSLPFPRIDMLDSVEIDGAPLYWTGLGGIHSGCLRQTLLVGEGEESRTACFFRQVECFSLERLLVSVGFQFFQDGQMCCVFLRLHLGHPTPHRLDQLSIWSYRLSHLSLIRKSWAIPSIY
jgi:hypothetical protein